MVLHRGKNQERFKRRLKRKETFSEYFVRNGCSCIRIVYLLLVCMT